MLGVPRGSVTPETLVPWGSGTPESQQIFPESDRSKNIGYFNSKVIGSCGWVQEHKISVRQQE